MTRRGFYLALEGVEGAGKSTLGRAVITELERREIEALAVREPGGTELGEAIRRLLLHAGEMTPWAEAALFAAQRAQLVAEVIGPALGVGRWVVSDRTYYSSLAYQGAARGLGVGRVRMINETVLEGVVPDLVVVIDVAPEVGLERQAEPDRIGGSGLEFQQAVADAYRTLAEGDPERVVLLEPSDDPSEDGCRVVELALERWSR